MTSLTKGTGGLLRGVILLVVTGLVLAGAGIYAYAAFKRLQDSRTATPAVAVAAGGETLPEDSFVLFRNTASGQGYGMAATVSLANPAGPRNIGPVSCDRVYSSAAAVACLSINRGLVTSFQSSIYGRDWELLQSWALRGIPSRTRISTDGAMVATTVFVTGHSYAGSAFSTEAVIRSLGGDQNPRNLEDFALLVNGEQVTASDRNIWGVTFVPGDPDSFYATAASSGRHWLVRGSLSARTLTAVHDGVECPSISPDGTRIAFKKSTGAGPTLHWNIAVLDLSSGQVEVLGEKRSVDDQIEWLNNETLLYGLPRTGEAGDSDIWQVPAEGKSAPTIFIEHAWSPSVVQR